MEEEVYSLGVNGTWEIVDRPPNVKVLPGHWVLRVKADGRYKAKYVVGGHRQEKGVDYGETFAAVARSGTVRIFVALTAIHGLSTAQLDVLNAFLNSKLTETVYV